MRLLDEHARAHEYRELVMKGDSSEVQHRLNAIFERTRTDPQGEFTGEVKDGWVRVMRKRDRLLGFHCRGSLQPGNDGTCKLELHITPNVLTGLLIAVAAIAAFLAFVFATVLLFAANDNGERRLVLRLLVVLPVLVAAPAIVLLMRKPLRMRREIVELIRTAMS